VESAIVNGVKLFLGANVESITKLADDFIVRTVCVETNDFWIAASSKDPRFIHVAGISSPGLTAAPAIAHIVIALIKAQTELVAKPDFIKKQATTNA
jgi:L-2-hydroxyglutarate oxidase LhgO